MMSPISLCFSRPQIVEETVWEAARGRRDNDSSTRGGGPGNRESAKLCTHNKFMQVTYTTNFIFPVPTMLSPSDLIGTYSCYYVLLSCSDPMNQWSQKGPIIIYCPLRFLQTQGCGFLFLQPSTFPIVVFPSDFVSSHDVSNRLGLMLAFLLLQEVQA